MNDKNLLKNVFGKKYKQYMLVYFPLEEKNIFDCISNQINKISHEKHIILPTRIKNNLVQILQFLNQNNIHLGIFISHIEKLLKKKTRWKELFELEHVIRKNQISISGLTQFNN